MPFGHVTDGMAHESLSDLVGHARVGEPRGEARAGRLEVNEHAANFNGQVEQFQVLAHLLGASRASWFSMCARKYVIVWRRRPTETRRPLFAPLQKSITRCRMQRHRAFALLRFGIFRFGETNTVFLANHCHRLLDAEYLRLGLKVDFVPTQSRDFAISRAARKGKSVPRAPFKFDNWSIDKLVSPFERNTHSNALSLNIGDFSLHGRMLKNVGQCIDPPLGHCIGIHRGKRIINIPHRRARTLASDLAKECPQFWNFQSTERLIAKPRENPIMERLSVTIERRWSDTFVLLAQVEPFCRALGNGHTVVVALSEGNIRSKILGAEPFVCPRFGVPLAGDFLR